MERVTKKIGRSSGKIGLHTTKNDADQHDGRGGGDVSTVAGECSQRSSGTLHLRMGKERGISDANHDLSDIFGESSPLAKLYALNGKVLLLGTGYNKNTSMHLADVRAEYAGKHMCIEHSAIWENGKRVWKAYETLFVDGEDFEQIGADFEKEHAIRMTQIGNAAVRLMRQRELVDYAVTWMEKKRV